MKEQLSKDMMERLSNDYFLSMYKPFTNVYIDMDIMYDYRLSALISLCRTEAEYNYIMKRLPTYAKYKGRQITKVFPSLKFTEEQLSEALKDPRNTQKLSEASLLNNLVQLVPAQISLFDDMNKRSPLYKGEPINLHFINKHFIITDQAALKINNSMSQFKDNIICHFRHNEIGTEDEMYLSKMNQFILDDIQDFVKETKNSYRMLIEERKFFGTSIFASDRLDDDTPWMEDEGAERLSKTEKFFSMFAHFMFFDKQLLHRTTS